MTNSPQIVILGTDAHADYVRRIMAHTDAEIHIAQTVWDTISLMRNKSCDILFAELSSVNDESYELLSLVQESCSDCLTIFRIPSSRISDAVRLVRRGAYSCVDDQTPEVEASEMLDRAILEVQS